MSPHRRHTRSHLSTLLTGHTPGRRIGYRVPQAIIDACAATNTSYSVNYLIDTYASALTSLSVISDVEARYELSGATVEGFRYLVHRNSNSVAKFRVPGIFLDPRLPPVTEGRFHFLRHSPEETFQQILIWGAHASQYKKIVRGLKTMAAFCSERADLDVARLHDAYIRVTTPTGPVLAARKPLLSAIRNDNFDRQIPLEGIEEYDGLIYTEENVVHTYEMVGDDIKGWQQIACPPGLVRKCQLGVVEVAMKVDTSRGGGPKIQLEMYDVTIVDREASRWNPTVLVPAPNQASGSAPSADNSSALGAQPE